MQRLYIINPITNHKNKMFVWDLTWETVLEFLKSGRSVKELSWDLLSDNKSLGLMKKEEYGDAADNNFSLSVFETALDWSLGMTVINFVKFLCSCKKKIKEFRVAATRRGDVFILTSKHVFFVKDGQWDFKSI